MDSMTEENIFYILGVVEIITVTFKIIWIIEHFKNNLILI